MRDKAVVEALDGIRTSIEGLTRELSKTDEAPTVTFTPPKPDAPTAVYVDASGSVGGHERWGQRNPPPYAGFRRDYFEKAQAIITMLQLHGEIDVWSYSGADSSEGPDGTFTRGLKCKFGGTTPAAYIADHARRHGYSTMIVVTDRLNACLVTAVS